jgi:hypothetical protein
MNGEGEKRFYWQLGALLASSCLLIMAFQDSGLDFGMLIRINT